MNIELPSITHHVHRPHTETEIDKGTDKDTKLITFALLFSFLLQLYLYKAESLELVFYVLYKFHFFAYFFIRVHSNCVILHVHVTLKNIPQREAIIRSYLANQFMYVLSN